MSDAPVGKAIAKVAGVEHERTVSLFYEVGRYLVPAERATAADKEGLGSF